MKENRLIYRLRQAPEAAPSTCRTTYKKLSCEKRKKLIVPCCIKNVPAERMKQAKKDLKNALRLLKKWKDSGRINLGRVKIDFDNPDRYLPLMIKESKLDNSAVSRSGARGYFQILSPAYKDIEKFFKVKDESTGTKKPLSKILGGRSPIYQYPTNNCIYGILYYHLCIDRYAGNSAFGNQTAQERKKLGFMLYNAGFGTIRRLWRKLKPKSFKDFEKKLSDLLAKQLGVKAGPFRRTFDKNYEVCYQEHPAIKKYIELYSKNPWHQSLQKTFRINNTPLKGISTGKVGEVLRYVRMIEAISQLMTRKTVGRQAAQSLTTPPRTAESPRPTAANIPASYKIGKKETLWGIARKFAGRLNISVGDLVKKLKNLNPKLKRRGWRVQAGEWLRLTQIKSTRPRLRRTPSATRAPATQPRRAPRTSPTQTPKFSTYTIESGDSFAKLSKNLGVSRKYLEKINDPKVIKMHRGEKIKVPALSLYKTVLPYLHDAKWITVTPKKGFYSTIVKNPAYNAYLGKEVQLSKREIQTIIIDFNRTFNPELANINESASNIPKGAKIWIPNVKYFLDYYGGTIRAPRITPPRATQPQPRRPQVQPRTPETIPGSIELDKKTIGQYARKTKDRNGRTKWIRDLSLMRSGMEQFKRKKWSDHPKWNDRYLGRRTIFGGRHRLKNVQYVILHSTDSTSSRNTVHARKAHFVVEKDGRIKYLIYTKKDQKIKRRGKYTKLSSKYKIAPHAGISTWDNTFGLNQHSIGIEVVAKYPKDWTPKQYAAIKKLCKWLGGYFGLRKRDILHHKQVSYSRGVGRGYKSDPYGHHSRVFHKLGLPDNSRLLDLSVVKGNSGSNITRVRAKKDNQLHGPWGGLEAAVWLKSQ